MLTATRKLCTWYPSAIPPYKNARAHDITTDIFVDNVHIELSLWDTAGQEEFDRLRSLSYDDTHTIMLCFSVDSKDSLENVESKWVSEIAENCQGVKLVLVALKCDLREKGSDDEDQMDQNGREKVMIDYKQGLEVAKRIQALRYLGGSKSIPRTSGLEHRMLTSELNRVLRKAKQRCQRSIHRSSTRRPFR